eukprot:TRINITY_DN6533_c0_g1_i1.p1 TRINITY_DN6533_c0_g1~~TRINITY_DN6533_c0_g1_i1.p1  ORF type:complete len:132 (+),score=32.91 TRINITY_DN6533_c0_g1_i1:78-473(+)
MMDEDSDWVDDENESNVEDENEGKWGSGLFDVSIDYSTYYSSLFCFPCQLAKIKAISDDKNCNCLTVLKTFSCPCYYSLVTRKKIRKRYGISGSKRSDYIHSMLFCCCAVAQETRELKMHGFEIAPLFMTR